MQRIFFYSPIVAALCMELLVCYSFSLSQLDKYFFILQMSPVDLLNSRDKFRQAPPPNLTHVKCGEVEGCFNVLISLFHIRKLLSGHGIRPAYDMLEEKLKQGYEDSHFSYGNFLVIFKFYVSNRWVILIFNNLAPI